MLDMIVKSDQILKQQTTILELQILINWLWQLERVVHKEGFTKFKWACKWIDIEWNKSKASYPSPSN
jgi:hypothetical protein